MLAAAGLAPRLALLAEALEGGPAAPPPRPVGPDDVASLIFTSGTTGKPKGVMLTHRNFASLVSRLAGVFDLGPGDGLLSVLPLHHTFEFTCGLLVPLSRGAEVEYLGELTADALGDALEEGRVTAMIGVPALWSLLPRRITQELSARPGAVEAAFGRLRQLNAALRERYALNLGKLLFWPVHRKLGGRLAAGSAYHVSDPPQPSRCPRAGDSGDPCRRPSLKVGIVLNLWPADPASEDPADVVAANHSWERSESLFLDPLFKGHYPVAIHDLVGPNMPEIRAGDMALIGQKRDFLGVNYRLLTQSGFCRRKC